MQATVERPEIDNLKQDGREPAICELRCSSCGDGLGFSQKQCQTCGDFSPRFAHLWERVSVVRN